MAANSLYHWYRTRTPFWRFALMFVLEFVFFFGANVFKYWYFSQADIPWTKVLIETSIITLVWSLIWQFRTIKAIVKRFQHRRATSGSSQVT